MKFQLLLFSFFFSIFYYCKPPELKVSSVEHCDYYTMEGKCEEPHKETTNYYAFLPSEKKIDTWEKVSHFLYFHTKQTPGLIIRFNRKLTLSEQIKLKETLKVYYDFSGTRGRVERVDYGEDWIAFFQYLGSMLNSRVKETGEEAVNPFLNLPKPGTIKMLSAQLTFLVESGVFQLQEPMPVQLKLEIPEPPKKVVIEPPPTPTDDGGQKN